MHTEQDIQKALLKARSLHFAKIVMHYDGIIILAQNESDYKSKVHKIQNGDRKGFYTVEDIMGNIEKT